MDTLVGRKLGKYQIESLLGRGGMATVYRAHDTALNRSVAIKVLDPNLTIDPRSVERFRREAVTSANLEHPSIVRVYDVQQEGNLHYIAMRYVSGTTLRDILRDNGPLPLDAITNIIRPVAAALHYAHRNGVIHRDVKPGNILVEPDGTVLLTDFGIARAADQAQSGLTATGQVMGTADYLAPEQISGKPAEARSDIYSLGVVLYELLTGVTPFSGETTASILYRQVHDSPAALRSINPRLPVELQPIVDRALAKNPALRYGDPMEIARDLEEVAQWLPPGSPWLNRGSGSPTSTGDRSNNKRPSGPVGVYAPVGMRTASRPHTGPRPYISDAYEVPVSGSQPQFQREVLAPQRGGRSFLFPLLALALVVAGATTVAFAAGALRLPGGSADRFQPAGPRTYNGPLREGPTISIPRALIAPNIDGELSDWAGAAPGPFSALDITDRKGPEWQGPDDLSAQFYFTWDDANFYIAAVVTDDVHVQFEGTRGEKLYLGDDLEFWFDTDLAGDFASARAESRGDDFQLGLSPGNFAELGPEAFFWNPDKNDERNKSVRVAAQPRQNNNGYTLEAAVPWTAFGEFRPQPGQAIGFAASAGDNDRPGVAIQELMISTTPKLRYREPFTFGNLFF